MVDIIPSLLCLAAAPSAFSGGGGGARDKTQSAKQSALSLSLSLSLSLFSSFFSLFSIFMFRVLKPYVCFFFLGFLTGLFAFKNHQREREREREITPNAGSNEKRVERTPLYLSRDDDDGSFFSR